TVTLRREEKSDLEDGECLYYTRVTDRAGNSSTSNAIEVIVDNTKPVAGTLAFANLDDTGSSQSPAITRDGTFDLSLSGNSDANGSEEARVGQEDEGAGRTRRTTAASDRG